jgi:hypothetical protein
MGQDHRRGRMHATFVCIAVPVQKEQVVDFLKALVRSLPLPLP